VSILHQKITGLYAITPNRPLCLDQIKELFARQTVNILQYRHKTSDSTCQYNEAKALKTLCEQHHTLFIINDDINLAKKVGADGVHLGKNDTSISKARQQLGTKSILGVSCYNNISLAQQAQQQGANYLAFGALFPSKTKPNAPHCSLSIIQAASQQFTLPIVGIGGINFTNQNQALTAGCHAVAMISALFPPTDSMLDSTTRIE
jgi:thiamine-phosphate pyrophosphorylase